MELNLEVVLSSSIKRKKPWPRFCWLGQEKESVFLLDDKRISEINMVSGRTKKRIPKLQPLLNNVVTMASSHNGLWLCGLLVSGELFLWNRDKDLLKTAAAAPDVVKIVTAAQGNATRLSLQVSGDGMRVLLVTKTGQVFLWECIHVTYLMGVRDGTVRGQWAYIQPLEDTILPSSPDKEASHDTLFIKTEAMGDACISAFVFTSEKKLIITIVKIHWEGVHVRVDSVGYSVQWATKTYPLSRLTPPCQPVKSRGALVPAFSPDGQLLAIVLNQRQPKATQVLFVSTNNFVSISSSLGGCGSKKMGIPSKYIRSYWVGSVSWSPDSLFLACVLKRGSLLMLVRLGGLLTLSSTGCNIDFGPAHFLPLHPLVTYRPTVSVGKEEASLSSSSLSLRDLLRQRYSVAWHPRLLYLIVSDGYMATVMKVIDRPSPAILLKMLLKDTSEDLKKASQALDKSQTHVKAWLECVSGLNLDLQMFNPTVTCGPNTADTVISAATDHRSTLPLFLQDQSTLGSTKELLGKVQTFFEDDSDLDGRPVGSHLEEGGCLEFASMFDTLHALDTHTGTGLLIGQDETDFVETERNWNHCELEKIPSKLLTAWAFGMSLGQTVEHRTHLLKQTLHSVVWFAALLGLIPTSVVHTGKESNSVSTYLMHLLKDLLAFLPWDNSHSDGPCCLGLMVDFCKRLVRLLLCTLPESYQTGLCQLSSQSLSTVLVILQLVSDSLDNTYSLQQKAFSSSVEKESLSRPSQVWVSDVHGVPLLQNGKGRNASSVPQVQPCPQRPSSRLLGVWQWVYKITQQYMEELKIFKGCDGWEEEQQQLSVIMSQIQTALQATGERLGEGPTLLGYPGEHLFLCGMYPKSADLWRSQVCDQSNKGCDRSVFQETRSCLALLYSLLSQYRLREAQELGDHMACLILHRGGHQKDNMSCKAADSFPCPWLPIDLHTDAAYAVVQTLGRFMASYFTNQSLYILPPHNVAVLPPLHLPHGASVGRLVPLCQQEVSKAARQQHLSEVWTVEYAQDLLLLGGLLPETVWLAYHLRDWKTAVSLSLAYKCYCTDYFDFTQLKRRELHLPIDLEPESIFRAELESHLCCMSDSQEDRDNNGNKSFTDPLEEEGWDLLQVSMQEILKASVMAGVNVLSSPLSSLLDTSKALCSSLPVLVPNGLYLPSPPLYCPQPSPNTQDPVGTQGQFAEVASRHKVSGVLQRLLLLLRSAHCCHPAAQWYISHLCRARHILHKIKRKYSYPSAAEKEKAFPEGLIKFVTRSGFFRQELKKEGHLDPDSIQTIISFRELCGICWMLHVRDQLSISCRKYQLARQHGRDEQIPSDSEGTSACIDALRWACRCLPFARFLNAEEILQDILLSLVSELPPVSLVADILVQAFPEEEESVRVPLREKYNSLLQRVRQCNVLGEREEANELMMLVIQDKHRLRRKHLGRLRRHLAPTELHLWEKEEEEEDQGTRHGMAMLTQLSVGTSLSTSTLGSLHCAVMECSDGDAEAISSEQHCRLMSSEKPKKINHIKQAVKKESIQEESQPDGSKGNKQPSLPVVGTWEFELEDEEYLNFLELFLSYVLEKDSSDGGDSSSELPLLKGYSSQLKERELHSLTFDILTTVHRCQRDRHHPGRKHGSSDTPVFRAGCCYKLIKQDTTSEPQTCSVWREAHITRTSLSVSSDLRTGKQRGLFGLSRQNSVPFVQVIKGGHSNSEASPIQSAFSMGKLSQNRMLGSSTSVEAVIEVQQGLDPKLEAEFPELGRLLEWMLRWSDRKVLLGHHGKRKERRGGVGVTVDVGVVIRVKASAPAVLTSLSLLKSRYTALLGSDCHSAHIQVPETQWTVFPAIQPVVDRNLERESSVDTGYLGSANTPITGLDHNMQQEELSLSHTNEQEELIFPGTPFLSNQNQPSVDAQMRQPSLNDLDVTPEKEVKRSNGEEWEASSSVSHGNLCTPETSLKLADLDLSENAEDTSSSISVHSHQAQPEAQACSLVQPEALVHADLSSTEALLPNTLVDSPKVNPQSSTDGSPTVSTDPNQPLPTETPPIRQRLGEDLFRLVQHINYMSLMEVLGASFSNLQLAQQSINLAQSNRNSSHPNVPSSYATSFIPQPSSLPVQTTFSATPQTQACVPSSGSNNPHVCMFADQPAVQSSVKTSSTGSQRHTSRQLLSANSERVHCQEIQPLSVAAESPDIQLRESRNMIPFSQGLMNTTDTLHEISTAPAVLPLNTRIQNDPAMPLLGLKLLQFHCPLSQQSATRYPVAQGPQMMPTENSATLECHQLKLRHPATSKMAEEEKECGTSVPERPISSHNHLPDRTPRNCQPLIQMSERFQQPKFNRFPPVLPSSQSLHLLHFKPIPHSQVTFPKVPMPTSSSQSLFIPAPMGETPMIKLLHIESGPKMMLPLATPSTQMAHLISTEQLTSSVIKHNAEDARFQLLRVDPPIESTRAAFTPSTNTGKRQKRREEKAGQRKTEVTFRPNESIIPPTDEPGNKGSAAADQITPGQNINIQPGSFDSALTGQRLLDKAMSTSVELHAFASTCKRPPQCHDAFTNTEPTCPLKLVDKAVSACVTVCGPELQSPGSIQVFDHHTVQDREETSMETQNILNMCGRQFISVLDLENQVLNQGSPTCVSPEVTVPIRPSPTTAQLQALAASVIRSSGVADADLQPSDLIMQNLLQPTTHTDIPEEPPSISHTESNRDSEFPWEIADSFDADICQVIKSQSVGPHRASTPSHTTWFFSGLSELDAQMAALQKIADSLETDYSNSRLLVNSIAKLTPDLASDVKSPTALKKTVRLSVPQEAWAPQPDMLTKSNVSENEKKHREEENAATNIKPSFPCPIRWNSRRDSPSDIRTPPNEKEKINEASEMSEICAEEDLGQSGLSDTADTADILDELIKEGYLSSTDVDCSFLEAAHKSSRLDQQRNTGMSQTSVLPEEERRELRTWMRTKQRERLAVYQKHRESLREREHKPFTACETVESAKKTQETIRRTREEKERFHLLEQYNRRTNEACSLVSDLFTSPPIRRHSSQREVALVPSTMRSTSALASGSPYRSHSVSANYKRSLKFQSPQSHHRPWTADVQGSPSNDHRRRLGLHRPVTSLPRDRLSQVTRRGMLTDNRRHIATQAEGRHAGYQEKTGFKKTLGREIQREQIPVELREEENLLEPTSEMNRLLGFEELESDLVLAGLFDKQGDGASGIHWLDNISEGASSTLSKIDWAAIEKLAPAEED